METFVDDLIELHKNRFRLLKEIDRPKIGWISIYTPVEIIEAAGAIPRRITGETAPNAVKAGGYMHRNVCPYVLSCFEEALTGGARDFGDGAVIVNSCDGRRRLYDVWKYFLDSKVIHFLNMPKTVNQGAKNYFRNEFLKLIQTLEETYGCKITEDKIRESIFLHNETRRLLKELYDLRKAETPPISGSQAIQVVKSAMTGFNEEFNLKLRGALGKSAEEPKPEESCRKARILIGGGYFDHIEITELLENAGATIVCEDISNGVKYFEGSVDIDAEPVEALAEYYLEKSARCGMVDSEKRFNHTWSLIREYKADAVVYFSMKFCDNNLIDFSYHKERLKSENVPVFFLEIERSVPNLEQIKTRVQTFLETV